VPRSTVDRFFRNPPPTVLPLTVGGGGGGGSGIGNNEGAYTNGSDVRAQIHGSDWILDPPTILPLTVGGGGGGGSGMLVNYRAQIYG
jgi:hypothetical protein